MDKFLGASKRLYTTERGGYITLISVIVVAALGVTMAASVLLLGLGSARTSFVTEQSAQARALADACAETTLNEIRDSLSCGPALSDLTFGNGSCSSTVITGGLVACTVNATGTVGNVVRRTQVKVDSPDSAMVVVSWREVADF